MYTGTFIPKKPIMLKKLLPLLAVLLMFFGSCAMMQSIIKSTFPYTTTLTVSATSEPGKEYSAVSMATSFDQSFSKNGNNGDQVGEVRVVSAKLRSVDPSDFNIGNLVSVKFYIAQHNGEDEVLVASRTDITEGVGNNIVLDIDNSNFLDRLIRQPDVRIRMVYVLRHKIDTDAGLHFVLGLSAYPNKQY